jgi:hypothetical protein
MKILLDESAPQKLRLLIDSRHTVVTTWFKGWSGLKNGALLSAADEVRIPVNWSTDSGGSGPASESLTQV